MTRFLAIIIAASLTACAPSAFADSISLESGQAHVKYHDFELTADVIDGGLDDIQAQGSVVFTTSDGSFSGDFLNYVFKTKSFSATGGVQATYQNYTLQSEHVRGSLESGQLEASGGVQLASADGTIRSDRLAHNLRTREFEALGSVKAEYLHPEQGSTLLTADRVFGNLESTIEASGSARIEGESGSIQAERISYSAGIGQFRAEGSPQASFVREDENEVILTAGVVFGNVGMDEVEASDDVFLRSPLGSIESRSLVYNVRTRWFSASGEVEAVYHDPEREEITLSADTVSGNTSEGSVEAVGDVSLQTVARFLTGSRLTYNLSTEEFTAGGGVNITESLEDGSNVVLQALGIEGDWGEGEIEATGQVVFSQGKERSLSGDTFTYNFRTHKGIARNASAEIDKVYFHGEELRTEPDRYIISRSRFTTCDAENPHYYLSARELIVKPDERITVRGMGLNLLGHQLFRLPTFFVRIGDKGGRGMKLPILGVNSGQGVFAGYDFDLSLGPTTGNLDLRMSTRQGIQGELAFQEIAGKPIFLRAAHRQPTYSGIRSDLLVSRLPEIGVRLNSSGLGDSAVRNPRDLFRGAVNPFDFSTGSRGVRLMGEVGAGRFIEEPGDMTSDRVEGRVIAWIDPISLDSHTVFTPGLSARLSHYGTGDDYSTLGLRLGVARALGKQSFASLAYITHSVHGNTPFDFDRLELEDELAGRVGFPLMGLNLELGGRYDLNGNKFFDSEITVSKVFHCLEPSITWRSRFKEISIGVGLVGF